MATRLQIMKKLAIEEAKKLKTYATAKELERINFKDLDPTDESACIYGLATGDCNNPRAQSLIIKCAPRVYDARCAGFAIDKNAPLNGKPYKVKYSSSRRSSQYQSPIEMLIYGTNGGKKAQKAIVKYLKGETKTLKL